MPTGNGTGGESESAVTAAKIGRTATIVAALIAAAGSVVTAVLAGSGTEPGTASPADPTGGGTAAMPSTGSDESTSTGEPGAPPPTTDGTETHLIDEDPVDGDHWNSGEATILHRTHPRTLLVKPRCSSWTTYNIPPGARALHTVVGVTDDSPSHTIEISVFLDERKARTVSVAPGKTAELVVDLGAACRVELRASGGCKSGTLALIDPVLR